MGRIDLPEPQRDEDLHGGANRRKEERVEPVKETVVNITALDYGLDTWEDEGGG